MDSDFDEQLRRRFAAVEPVAADAAFTYRLGAVLRRRRRQRQALSLLGSVAFAVGIALLASLLAPLADLAQRGAAAFVALSGEAQTSPLAAVLVAALVVGGVIVNWTLRRL